ncbi:MAG: hypothetical protein HYT80_02340 [Euryarchaeota archaeon]|nr:hypothetical protein [Euryarchaeota archaeon]
MRRTTIQVQADLLPELEEVKREVGASSYDGAIRALLQEHRRLPTSSFGRFRKLPPFKRDELDRLD